MSQIYTYNNNKQYPNGKPGTVLKGSDIDWRAYQVIAGDGSLTMTVAMRFGKDPTTGEPQVALLPFAKISELFVECPKDVKAQIIAEWDAARNPEKDVKLEAATIGSIMNVDVESLGKADLEKVG